jgi:hypothetical protein
VKFLAASTLIRGTFGENEDTFLAQVLIAHGAESKLIRLIDAYANEAPPLSVAALRSESGTLMRIERDPRCDRLYGELPLRAAPGDSLAILPTKLSYLPHLELQLPPESILPCYRTVRP